MIELSNMDVQRAAEALRELGQERLPVAGALKVRKLVKAVQAHLDDVEGVRKELLSRYACKDEHDQLVLDERGNATFEADGLQQFQADYLELMEQTVEFEHGLTVADLGSIEVRPATLVALGALLEEGEEGCAAVPASSSSLSMSPHSAAS